MKKKISLLILGAFWGLVAMNLIMSVGKEIPTHTFNWWDALQIVLILCGTSFLAIETYNELKDEENNH